MLYSTLAMSLQCSRHHHPPSGKSKAVLRRLSFFQFLLAFVKVPVLNHGRFSSLSLGNIKQRNYCIFAGFGHRKFVFSYLSVGLGVFDL